jgi:hypothetical protein
MFDVLSPLLSVADTAGLTAVSAITGAFVTGLIARYKLKQQPLSNLNTYLFLIVKK